EPNERAISIPMGGPGDGLGGWVRPRDKVDLFLTMKTTKTDAEELGINDGGATTSLLLPNVEVLAVGAISKSTTVREEGKDLKFRTVTVKVTAQDAIRVALGANMGTVGLILRNRSSKDNEIVKSVTRATLLGYGGGENAINGDDGGLTIEDKLKTIENRLSDRYKKKFEELEDQARGRAAGPGGKREEKVMYITKIRGGHSSVGTYVLPKANDTDNPN
ncbi:MAG: Flp pilus assembly protein CpaB, partial [Planctomycetales bacterium]